MFARRLLHRLVRRQHAGRAIDGAPDSIPATPTQQAAIASRGFQSSVRRIARSTSPCLHGATAQRFTVTAEIRRRSARFDPDPDRRCRCGSSTARLRCRCGSRSRIRSTPPSSIHSPSRPATCVVSRCDCTVPPLHPLVLLRNIQNDLLTVDARRDEEAAVEIAISGRPGDPRPMRPRRRQRRSRSARSRPSTMRRTCLRSPARSRRCRR